ncbi:MAG: hypothetical protein AAFX50_10890, partial [Acidobacteriota bacterium]
PADPATPPALVQSTPTSGGDAFRYVWYRDHVGGPDGSFVKLMHLDTGETERRFVIPSAYTRQFGMLRGVADPDADRWGRGAMGAPGNPNPALRVVVEGNTTAPTGAGAVDAALDYSFQPYAMARPSLGGRGVFYFPYRLQGSERVGKWIDLAEEAAHPHNSTDTPVGGFGTYAGDPAYPPQMVFPVGATPTY